MKLYACVYERHGLTCTHAHMQNALSRAPRPASFVPAACLLQKGCSAAAQEAENWQQNASAWCAALMQQHPLYRDVVQPVALAVYEVRCGLSLLKHAARLGPEQQVVDDVLADCMGLPSRLGQGKFLLPVLLELVHILPAATVNASCTILLLAVSIRPVCNSFLFLCFLELILGSQFGDLQGRA